MAQVGTHALITGGGGGIGAAVARALAGAGSVLSLAGRRAAPLGHHLTAAAPMRRTRSALPPAARATLATEGV